MSWKHEPSTHDLYPYVPKMARISLPAIEVRSDAKGHPFPIQIAYQTQEFIQGALFYASFADLAAGETVSRPGGVEAVEARMKLGGLGADVTDQGWVLLGKYRAVFGSVVFQSVLITLCSHRDWYIRKLSRFILFARNELKSEPLPKAVLGTLGKPDRSSIKAQIEAICDASGFALSLADSEVRELVEMSLVRNLGLHNRWEVDEVYAQRTVTNSPAVGELRVVDAVELQRWHALLIKLLHQTAFNCSGSFHGAPEYTM